MRFDTTMTLIAATTAVLASPALAQNLEITRSVVAAGGGTSSGGSFSISGTIGQHAAGPLSGGTFDVSGGFWQPAPADDPGCESVADCADVDGNGIRDDNCLFWACEANSCVSTDIVFADMGGAFGDCPVDGTADGNDRFHALNCFSNTDPGGSGGYPCEAAPPAAMNVDAGGAFGSCSPDGVCDGNDAFAALNAFGAISSCSCPLDGGPAPAGPAEPRTIDTVAIELKATSDVVTAGELVEVEITIRGGVADLRGYQLHPTASPGLELVDMFVDERKDYAFAGDAYWDAYNLKTGQMVVGIDEQGISTRSDLYLATVVYRVSTGSGTLMVDLLHDNSDPEQRTFLFATPANGKVAISKTLPAVIQVQPAK